MRRSLVACRRWGRAAAVACALLATTVFGQVTPTRFSQGRFHVDAWPSDSVLARTLLTRASANDTFPGLPRARDSVLVVIAPDKATFEAMVGPRAPEWGAAFAFPGERRIVMQGAGAPSSAGDPLRVLRHELAHLALFEFLGAAAPRWFDEGYASYAAGEWDREDVIAANLGLALGRNRSLAALDSGFQLGSRSADASYALSFRAVAELAALDPARGLTLFMARWKELGSFDRALRSAHGLTTGSFEALWVKNTRRRYGAVALFADLTVGVTVLLLIIGPLWVFRRRRDRARMAALVAAEAEAARREREAVIEALLASVSARPGDEPHSS